MYEWGGRQKATGVRKGWEPSGEKKGGIAGSTVNHYQCQKDRLQRLMTQRRGTMRRRLTNWQAINGFTHKSMRTTQISLSFSSNASAHPERHPGATFPSGASWLLGWRWGTLEDTLIKTRAPDAKMWDDLAKFDHSPPDLWVFFRGHYCFMVSVNSSSSLQLH